MGLQATTILWALSVIPPTIHLTLLVLSIGEREGVGGYEESWGVEGRMGGC